MAKIVVGVCGSVAAVRVPELIRKFVRRGYGVEVVMSYAAHDILHENVLEWASGEPVVYEITGAVEHVTSCGVDGDADLLLVCPATSNTISKIACGVDDTPVTTYAATALGSGKKIAVVPAMHVSMYENPFVAENIEKLKKHGVAFIGPRMEENKAKLAHNDKIVEAVECLLKK